MAKLPLFTAPQTAAETGFRWFVYGSTLDFDAFRGWCGEHGYVLPDLSAARPAVLPGWRLAFNVRSNFWGGTVASLVEDKEGRVEGVVIPLLAEALGFVRHKEGVVSGLYEEREASCLVDGKPVTAKVYLASPARTVPEGAPAPRFLQTILKGARERGLSAGWIALLEKQG
jgi:gamma-glutamylcyclotransferase